ncbi:20872_t:CDS:2 [Cetraspora pellucida]|uniref:20872_t:CDS:1 n=1 Tax=Cetraspora pellucida TaxID=1433469 RepID=A0A9N9IIQ0_9GLOM|nr:20872_t:CDS:2 [Cetraspora pellucida]
MSKAKLDAVYYKPSQKEILATRTDAILVNTRKAIDKWVQILKNWCQTFVFTADGGLRFTKYSQKNDQGGIESDNTGLIISVLPDPTDFQGPIHDLKLYISKHSENYQTPYLHHRINNKFAYKEDSLLSLINNIELPLKQVDNHIENITATQNNMQDNQAKLLESMTNLNLASKLANKVLNELTKKWKSVMKPFRTPLKSLSQSSEQQNFQLSEQQESYERSYQTSEDRIDRNMIVKNYYIIADNVTIN